MDEAGFETAHVAGNSLGGFVALQLAARGRARSVVALAPAGGWAEGDDVVPRAARRSSRRCRSSRSAAAPYVDELVAERGHPPPGDRADRRALGAHPARARRAPDRRRRPLRGVAPLIEYALRRRSGTLDAARIDCPVRIVWGTADRVLPWPSAAVRFREWLPRGRVGRARRRRPLPAARRAARDGRADPRLHRAVISGIRTRSAPGTISKRAGVVPTCSPSSSIGSGCAASTRDRRASQHLDARVRRRACPSRASAPW